MGRPIRWNLDHGLLFVGKPELSIPSEAYEGICGCCLILETRLDFEIEVIGVSVVGMIEG